MREQFWSMEEISSFCLELSLLLKAGLPGEECFSVLAEKEEDAEKKALLEALYEKCVLGSSWHGAMKEMGVFPPYLLKMVLVGEETGHLEQIFRELSVYYEKQCVMKRALKETVLFPIILLAMLLAVVVVLVTEVLPVFRDVFAQLGGSLSTGALVFLHFGELLRSGRFFFLALGILLLCFLLALHFSPKLAGHWKGFWQRRFDQTKIGRLFAEAELASVLNMTISGGLDTDLSMELAQNFLEETKLEGQVARCREKMQQGDSFSDALKEEGLMKPMYCRILAVGLKTGNLDVALQEVSKRTREEAMAALIKAASVVEPAVVILLSLIVGGLLLTVMFPLVGIMSSLG